MDVLVIDDHPLIVQAVTSVIGTLRPDTVVRSAESVEQIDQSTSTTAPDLVLLDLALPGVSGLSALQAVRERFPNAAIVIFSASQDSPTITRALRAGARGFIPKTSHHRVLADALQLVLDGGVYVPPDILASEQETAAQALAPAAVDPPGEPGATAVLTDRQRQIIALFADGLTTKEISRRLGISTNTVKSHVAVIFRTLGVSNRAQVVAITNSRPSGPSLH